MENKEKAEPCNLALMNMCGQDHGRVGTKKQLSSDFYPSLKILPLIHIRPVFTKVETPIQEKSFSPFFFFSFILANKSCKCNACAGEVTVRTKRIYCGPGDADSQQYRNLPHKLSVKIDNNSGAILILVF